MIYIHGFMGNETSFRSFPAHVHRLLTVLLAETHVVHTKIYPRYRSKRNISFARDDFSKWLEPHEDPNTDVVLLGHSMGGLLAAEVVLMPAPPTANRAFKHRILGTINFDVPFIGMNPGIVRSGLMSIFKPGEEPEDKYSPELGPVTSPGGEEAGSSSRGGLATPPNRQDTLWEPGKPDPNLNPTFNNDVVLPVRKGWRNAWHFINKHSGELGKATKKAIQSHVEFGGAMANYGELKARYARVRALAEESEEVRKSVGRGAPAVPRVRFTNYYTASTGRPKKAKSPEHSPEGAGGDGGLAQPSTLDLNDRAADTVPLQPRPSDNASPEVSVEEHKDDGKVVPKEAQIHESEQGRSSEEFADAAESLTIMDPAPVADSDEAEGATLSPTVSTTTTLAASETLPPVPELPPEPPALDLSFIQDLETKKLVAKEHTRAVKAYEKAVKDREKALAARAKLQEKRDKHAQKEAEKTAKGAVKAKKKAEKAEKKAEKAKNEDSKELTHSEKEERRLEGERKRMEAEGRRMRGEPEPPPSDEESEDDSLTDSAPIEESLDTPAEAPRNSPSSAAQPTNYAKTAAQLAASSSHRPSTLAKPEKPPKERNFCLLPPADSNGERDPAWVKIFMENVDEVGAHCGLFFVDERYERLVGDVAERVEGWVNEETGRMRADEMGEPSIRAEKS